MAQDLPHLSLLSPLRGEHRLACVALTHNEMRILPEFLAHYRRLGVDRFFLVDDHSTDGSRDYLMAQDDVTLYEPRRLGLFQGQALLARGTSGRLRRGALGRRS